MKAKSRFITFEGIDRCGKTTQAKLLKRNLGRLGVRCLVTAEPGGSGALGASIRDLLMDPDVERDEVTAAMMFCADRHEHVLKIIAPTLEKGIWVISDRFADSTMAYQGAGGNVDTGLLKQLNDVACRGIVPDLTVLLLIDTQKRAKRNPKLDYYDRGQTSYDLRVSAAFDSIAKDEPGRFLVIDGSKPIQEISDIIIGEIQERFIDGQGEGDEAKG